MFAAMSTSDVLKAEFNEEFSKVDPEKPPRPDLFGYGRLVRQVQQVEVTLVYLLRVWRPQFPLPTEPESAYELWQREKEDAGDDMLLADIFNANPKALGFNLN